MSAIIFQDKNFYPIPGFDGYFIAEDSDVYSARTGIIRRPQFNTGNGYKELSLSYGSSGGLRRVGVHRLMGLTFIPYEGDLGKLVINHINGVKHDNRVCNLEWVTYRGNAEHAGRTGLTTKCKPVSVISYPTLEITDFPSVVACARVLGFTKDIVTYRLRSNGDTVFPEGLMYIYTKDKESFFQRFDKTDYKEEFGHGRYNVVLRYILTGEIKEFLSFGDVAAFLKVSPATVTAWIKKEGQPVLPGCLQMKLKNDRSPWRQVTDPYRELAAFCGTKVAVVTDTVTGKVGVFTSLVACATANGLRTTAAIYRLKSKGKTIFSDGKRYALGSDLQDGPLTP